MQAHDSSITNHDPTDGRSSTFLDLPALTARAHSDLQNLHRKYATDDNPAACASVDEEDGLAPIRCGLIHDAASLMVPFNSKAVQSVLRCIEHRKEISDSARQFLGGHSIDNPDARAAASKWLLRTEDGFNLPRRHAAMMTWLSKRPDAMAKLPDDHAFLVGPPTETAKQSARNFVDQLSASAGAVTDPDAEPAGDMWEDPEMKKKQVPRKKLIALMSRRESMTCARLEELFQQLYPDDTVSKQWPILKPLGSYGADHQAAMEKLSTKHLDSPELIKTFLASYQRLTHHASAVRPETCSAASLRILGSKVEDQSKVSLDDDMKRRLELRDALLAANPIGDDEEAWLQRVQSGYFPTVPTKPMSMVMLPHESRQGGGSMEKGDYQVMEHDDGSQFPGKTELADTITGSG
jgi:hypothetical protein